LSGAAERRGKGPRDSPHSTPAGLGEERLAAQPTDRQTTRINQRETERPGVFAPGVIWLCAADSSRARTITDGTAKK